MTSAEPTAASVAATIELIHEMLPMLVDANDEWFDHNLIGNFGLDVFDRPFDPEVGHARYDGDRFTQSLIRLDHLDTVYRDALGPLFDRPIGPLVRANEAAAKRYAAHRSAVLAELRLTDDEIDQAAATRVVGHFFTPAEREELIRTWRSGGRSA
jgi:hypothetical protein